MKYIMLLSLFTFNMANANVEFPDEGNLQNDTYVQEIVQEEYLENDVESTYNERPLKDNYDVREPVVESATVLEERTPYEKEYSLDNYNKDRIEEEPYKDDYPVEKYDDPYKEEPYKDDYPVEKYDDPYKEEPYKDDYNSDAYPNDNDDYNNENY